MINIVLYSPEIPQNTGNISRTCAVTGARLHIIKPIGFEISDRTLKRAGLDYWDKLDITYYENTQEFFRQHPDGVFYFCTTKASNTYSRIQYPVDDDKNIFLVFGKETKGLPEDLLRENRDFCIRIPMKYNKRSLNLSNSVAIVAYEVLRQNDFENLNEKGFLSND